MLSWSKSILEKFVAPGLTTFVAANIPDLTGKHPEADHWLANYFLSSALSGAYKSGFRQAALAYLRRTSHAYVAYSEARHQTLQYLDGIDPHSPRIRLYFAAAAKWEEFALQLAMAMDAFRWLNGGTGAFGKNDGSKEYRLYTIANQIKHTTSCIDSTQCTSEDVLRLWMTSDKLSSFAGVEVTYEEAAEILSNAAEGANELQYPAGATTNVAGSEATQTGAVPAISQNLTPAYANSFQTRRTSYRIRSVDGSTRRASFDLLSRSDRT